MTFALAATPAAAEQCVATDLGGGRQGRICVSSVLPPARGITYGPETLIDNNVRTGWTENAAGYGVGQYIQVYLDQPAKLFGLTIVNGYPKSTNIYRWNSRVREVTLTLSNGQTSSFRLQDSPKPQFVPLPKTDAVSWVRIAIRSVYKGERYKDTVIAELKLDFGTGSALDLIQPPPPPSPPSD